MKPSIVQPTGSVSRPLTTSSAPASVKVVNRFGVESRAEVDGQVLAGRAAEFGQIARLPAHYEALARTAFDEALEAGARLVVVPMVNSAAEAREIVDSGKFPPLGHRGFNSRSRGTRFIERDGEWTVPGT